jgi:hypothetical protein
LNGNNAIWDTSRDGGRHLDWSSKAVRAVPYDAKFTGTVAHGNGGVLFLEPPAMNRNPFSNLSTAGGEIFSKMLLEIFPAWDDK